MAAAIGLGVNQLLSHLWVRVRPTLAHPDQAHLIFVPPSGDPSFPSDHATAAFAIAFAVFFVSRRVGTGFLVAATLVALSRVFVGLHYPSDVVAGVLIGAGSAWLVTAAARPLIVRIVDLIGCVWDPIAAPVWSRLGRLRPTR
jgi:undecaprenyl-diphosphatase